MSLPRRAHGAGRFAAQNWQTRSGARVAEAGMQRQRADPGGGRPLPSVAVVVGAHDGRELLGAHRAVLPGRRGTSTWRNRYAARATARGIGTARSRRTGRETFRRNARGPWWWEIATRGRCNGGAEPSSPGKSVPAAT